MVSTEQVANIEGFLRELMAASKLKIYVGDEYDPAGQQWAGKLMDLSEFMAHRNRDLERQGIWGTRVIQRDNKVIGDLLRRLLDVEASARGLAQELAGALPKTVSAVAQPVVAEELLPEEVDIPLEEVVAAPAESPEDVPDAPGEVLDDEDEDDEGMSVPDDEDE